MEVNNLNEEIAEIKWVVADLEEVFRRHSIPFTQENVDVFLNSRGCRTLHERSVEEGWEILHYIASDVFNK